MQPIDASLLGRPVWGFLFLVPLTLASCGSVTPSQAPSTASTVVIAEPSARAIVLGLLALEGSPGGQTALASPTPIQSVTEDTISEQLGTGKAQLAFGLGPPPEGYWAAPLGWEGILVVVRDGNPVRSILPSQLAGVFSGVITNWSALGPGTGSIHVISQEVGSPVRLAFDAAVLGGIRLSSESALVPDSAAVAQVVRMDSLAIGYLPCIDWAPGLSALPLGKVAPNGASIQTGEYSLRIPLVAIARQPPQGAWFTFLSWVQAPPGQRAFRQLCQP